MNNNINKLLQDIYKLDPELKSRENELIALIGKIKDTKNKFKPDTNFVHRLRNELMSAPERDKKENFINNYINMKKYIFGGAVAFVCLLLFAVVYYPLVSKNNGDQASLNLDLGKMNIESVDNFGLLSLSRASSDSNIELSKAMGLGESAGLGSAVSSDGSADSFLVMPAPAPYSYVYMGDDFEKPNEKGNVYKRVIPADVSKQFASFIKNINLGLVDLKNFNNVGLQNLTLVEDNDFGLIININLNSAEVSIYQNWDKWPKTETNLSITDIPKDDVVIAIANNFLSKYGIDNGNYGSPVVNNQWREYYIMNDGQGQSYVPDTMQVVYPLLVEGLSVYDQGGQPVGLNVLVNVLHKKVAGVNGLRASNYQSASYELISDVEELIAEAENGGFGNSYKQNNDNEIKVELGKPKVGLVKLYNYKNGQQEEMLVPSLIFDILDKPDGYYGRQKVIVLLVKEMEREQPMPMIEPAILR